MRAFKYLSKVAGLLVLGASPALVVYFAYGVPKDDQIVDVYTVTSSARLVLSVAIILRYIHLQSRDIMTSLVSLSMGMLLIALGSIWYGVEYCNSTYVLALFIAHSVSVPVYEELLFRHVPLFEFRSWTLISVTAISSLGFGVLHLVNVISFNSSVCFEMGLVITATAFGFIAMTLRLVFRSVIFSVVLHWGFNLLSVGNLPLVTGKVPHRGLGGEDLSLVVYAPQIVILTFSIIIFLVVFRKELLTVVSELRPSVRL